MISSRYTVALKNDEAFVISKISLQILNQLKKYGWLGYADLRDLVDCAPKSLYTIMKRLYDSEFVEKEYDTDIVGKSHVYFKVKEGITFVTTYRLGKPAKII